ANGIPTGAGAWDGYAATAVAQAGLASLPPASRRRGVVPPPHASSGQRARPRRAAVLRGVPS
ncbi:MAG TPA: hypothetical protein PKH97_13285, partial [Tetrasphaera sp.]|nr:hypothetical protein [Tetrasphaera sp.]